jgi:hypothetical protein
MKQLFTFISIFFLTATYAVENDTIKKTVFDNKTEIRIDVPILIAQSRVGLSYERFINKHLSGGLNIVLLKNRHFAQDNYYAYKYQNIYQINPYARFFFHQRKKKVFFAETFLTYHAGTTLEVERLNDGQYAYYAYQKNPISGWGGGVALGGKYYIKDNIVIELLLGAGSSRLENDNTIAINRSGIHVGYRF